MSRTRLPGHIPRLITALLTSVAVVFGLTACMNDTSKVPDDYITFFGGEPQNPLIPTNTQEINRGQVIENVFTGLARYTPDGEARNAVAESITPNGNSTSFRIKLRDWSFTNGEKITSDSFIDAWNWAVDPANAQLQSAFFAPIQGYTEVAGETDADGNVITEPTADTMSGLKKISDTEFTVTLSAPDSTFPLLLGYSSFVASSTTSTSPSSSSTSCTSAVSSRAIWASPSPDARSPRCSPRPSRSPSGWP